MKIEKREDLLRKGSLVKNIRSNSIGVVVEGSHKSEHSNQYYNVLSDGEVVRWFKPNIIEIEDERSYRSYTKFMA
jgi:hypothetical protein